MTSLLVLSLATNLAFPGGDDLSFVTWIADHSHRNVACVFDPGKSWKRVTFKVAGEKATLRELVDQAKISLSYAPSQTAFATSINISHWPIFVAFEGQPMPRTENKLWNPPPDLDRSGSFRMPKNTYLDLSTLRKLLKVDVRAHWFLEQVPFVIAAKSWRADDILPAVGLAIGGHAEQVGSAWTLKLSPNVLRSRFTGFERYVDGARSRRANSIAEVIYQADLRYTGSVYQHLTDRQVEALYVNREKVLHIPISTHGNVMAQARNRMSVMFPASSKDPTTLENRHVLEEGIDWGAGIQTSIRPRNFAAIRVRLRKGAMGDAVYWTF